MSLRRRTAIRAGASSVVVDETDLVLRTWFRRVRIPWSDVQGFEPRVDPAGDGERPDRGCLVALTAGGPIELRGTRRPLGQLRYVHALLDAYRMRAQRR